ncbi:hypothetical protein WR25_23462 isoform A [Diploscapter pachys]|uniref:Uncharacterized protein n=1 Tax=Diploscapter pachys TaxID=2018661 RepID=A0A2A2LTZ5_9BILA|nr:hypothetical protein WR25_23462 isoform A [Diploscapter pachys]
MVIFHNTGWLVCATLALVLDVIQADIISSCKRVCDRTYYRDELIKSCKIGCDSRVEQEDGPTDVHACQTKCNDTKQFFETLGEHKETDESLQEACDYACSLPTIRSVMITLNVNNGKSTSNVVKSEGVAGDASIEKQWPEPERNWDMNIGRNGMMELLRPKAIDQAPPSFGMTFEEEYDSMHRRMNEIAKNFMERARESRRRFLEMQDEKPNFLITIDDSPEKIDRKLNYAYLDNSNLYRCVVALLLFMAALALVLMIKSHNLRRATARSSPRSVSLPSYKSAVKDSMMTTGEKSGDKMAWTAVPPSDADFSGPPPYDVVTVPSELKAEPQIHESPTQKK